MPIRAVLAAALLAPVAAAAATHLDVKTGNWEMTSEAKFPGPLIDPEMLKQLPAEARERMASMMGSLQKPHTRHFCLTQEKLDKGFTINEGTGGHCQHQVIRATAQAMEIVTTCSFDGDTSTARTVVNAVTPETMDGKVEIDRTRDAGPQHFSVRMVGKWLGATCTKDDDTGSEAPDEH